MVWLEYVLGLQLILKMLSSQEYKETPGGPNKNIMVSHIASRLKSFYEIWFLLVDKKTFKETVREGGWKILYRGFGSTTYRAFIVNGVILFVYNKIMFYFGKNYTC